MTHSLESSAFGAPEPPPSHVWHWRLEDADGNEVTSGEGSTPTAEVTAMLEQDAGSYTWVAAAIGANTAAGYQLATEDPVMPVGGFNGTDPSPTLAEFQQYVADGRIHYFIGGGGMGGRESGSSAEISAWVTENFTATTVDNVTLYDLTQ